jgi:Ca2+-binding RTX toxin-like protein
MKIGMNLAGVSYYGAQYAFIDRFKASSEWMTQGANGQPTGPLSLDANGYPQGMPTGAVNIFTVVGLDPADRPMPDVYVLTFKGNATLDVMGTRIISSEPGKIVFAYSGQGGGAAINVQWIDPANPLSDMHVVRQDQLALYEAGEIFNPAFLDKVSQWSEIRYMDWGGTNNSTVKTWSQRTTVEDASWGHNSSTSSVPIEIMVALANKTGTDMWINIPAEADDDFVRRTLTYVRDNLAPNLSVKVEYSNEVWNWGFQQAGYSQTMGAAMFGTDLNGNGQIDRGTAEEPGTAYLQYYGYRSAQVATIANDVFGSEAGTRLRNVISSQTSYMGLEAFVFDGVASANLGSSSDLFHDYAITNYFGLDTVTDATVLAWSRQGQAGIEAAFAALGDSLAASIRIYEYQQNIAARNGLALVGYEGGLGLTAYQFADADQPDVLALFAALEKDPRMGDLYARMVSDFAANGGSGLNQFNDVGSPSKWGNWGVLESIYDTDRPRYDALVEASLAAKAAQSAGGDSTQVNVRTVAASYTLASHQMNLSYIGTGGFSGRGNDAANTIIGGNSFNMLYGGGGADTIVGGQRNDVIDGGTGADLMIGGYGDDTYTVDNKNDVVTELVGQGVDEVRTKLNSYTMTANVENLTFTGTGGFTGTGNDSDNVIIATAGQAKLSGGAGNDTLVGSADADTIDGGTGADLLRGGAGNDLYFVDHASDNVVELAGGGIDTIRTTLNRIGMADWVENLTFTGTGNFETFGNGLDNVIIAGFGDDTIWGQDGNDTLYGRAGNDVLLGGLGADVMNGGGGDDRYDVDDINDVVVEAANQGTDGVYSTISYTLGANVENLLLIGTNHLNGTGNALNNVIFGNEGNNILSGGAGNDSLIAGGGNDTLYGGTGDDGLNGDDGDDLIYGGDGADSIGGGRGNDVLVGGAGADYMDGGAGADRYVFYSGDTGRDRSTADSVIFSALDGDLIDLSNMDARVSTAGRDAFNFIGQSAFTRTAGELRIQGNGGYWEVSGDTNGDGVADFSITVSSGTTALLARDFIF